jgi:hypothetical protein
MSNENVHPIFKGILDSLSGQNANSKPNNNSFPDLGRSFAKMKLQDKLDAVSERTIFGMAILSARMNKMPLQELSKEIYSQYLDNKAMVADIVGQDTIDLIKEIYPEFK